MICTVLAPGVAWPTARGWVDGTFQPRPPRLAPEKRRSQALDYVKHNPRRTAKRLAHGIGIDAASATRLLNKLTDEGVLKRSHSEIQQANGIYPFVWELAKKEKP